MKKILLVLLLFFPSEMMCQSNEDFKLPKPDDIECVEISNTSMKSWYKTEELLKLLPELIPSEGTYLTKGVFERGVFVLKNGKRITWMVGDKGSILLYAGSAEQLYVLPKQEAKAALFPVWDVDGKDGFIDIDGNPVSTPNEETREFNEGLAPVKIGDKWGYVDTAGKVVIEPRWKTYNVYTPPVTAFSEGLAAVYDSPLAYSSEDEEYQTFNCGYIDRTGEYVIKPIRRQFCGPFHDGRAEVKVDPRGTENLKTAGDIGYINTKGNFAIPPKFVQAGNFMDGYALVNDKWEDYPRPNSYLIDKDGNKAAGVNDCRWRYQFYEGLALTFSAKEKRFDGYVNENCESVIKLPTDVFAEPGLSYFSQGLAAVYKQRPLLPQEESYSTYRQKTWGFIDQTGKIVLPLQYTNAAPFSDGFAVVGRERDGDTYIDLQGKPVFEGRIGSTASFKNGLAFQLLFLYTISEKPNARNIYGYMNRQGKYVWLSPSAKVRLGKEWIEKNYVGPQKVE